ncbi:hypothetical protein A2331_04800 [Candidatus Falkowbacteria bacterium RIFOXYB2_FULL_34_18]|uniref:DUF362 domain-containing protein n=1 Tax=Candidatus Falkowbacteria bacterium RIFOXYD2_FULL_34_120 TaxID=1798007 RepID=A0A1F5TNF4_9BACT|nr:MAG: hypothetical protein A2331_04800 [Candidatus Falkowbacteria bacterium RIFOXYB2_FULL_34_18]OGF28861.1 MAG: hypothetical protein A2500_00575 [Candidatus Falkowbacteria bacterium RIFOXYC12_FULL_34_55]OGF35766.1 MAG: hypothetical protein A2466_04495 [Candidatus Falkowbacteria bacterium RIFOXYC2_FULL_34_220]OGF38432.1 MAG: hypothetical protein A2515_01935 [Candidatus Falkowbacteria bacterium RIFOXYD12_FULL_34_57]OGF40512.1 MAG: hypothetical protein A2531_02990 [Candidatus Falkowbacteria bact
MSKVFISLSKSEELSHNIEDTLLKSTNNLSWLKPGDKVLLKVALNSPDPHPATTHPEAVKTIFKILKNRGAEVIVGDQSGIEHVVHTPKGIIKGSSAKNFITSQMGDENIPFTAFEDLGWDDGFFHFNHEKCTSWKNGFYISDIINRVDHIINLPRLSTHIQSGVTLGLKAAVGFLREDSRLEFHQDGPFAKQLNSFAKDSGLKTDYKNENKFIEKITEISLALQEKLRLTFYTASKMQTTFGPDKKLMNLAKSYVVTPEKSIIIASNDIISAEAAASCMLKYHYDRHTPIVNKFVEKLLLSQSNKNHISNITMENNKFINYGAKIGLGSKNFAIAWSGADENDKNNFLSYCYPELLAYRQAGIQDPPRHTESTPHGF